MKIQDIYEEHVAFWDKANRDFFGIGCRNWEFMKKDEVQKALDEDAAEYWNSENKCEAARLMMNETICKDMKFFKENSFEMTQNIISQCIDLSGVFIVEKKGVVEEKKLLIATFPTPCNDLTWIVGGNNGATKYTPRITCVKDYQMVHSDGKIITNGTSRSNGTKKSEDFWTYNISNKKFDVYKKDCHPFDLLSYRSKCLLEACLGGQELTKDNLEEALQNLPQFDGHSIFNFAFYHVDAFFNMIRSGNKFANPLTNIHLAVNTIFNRQVNLDDDPESSGKLVLINQESSISTLENFRTIVYSKNAYNQNVRGPKKKKKTFVPSFSFTQTQGFFDAFKTAPQSNSAGRQRLLLDNVTVHDGMLFVIDSEGKEHNMFELIPFEGQPQKNFSKSNISCISKSLFCNNNAPKRIMMTAKLSAQAVHVEGSQDNFTHRVPARVVFGEFKGWSYADSIIISESFAKKLKNINVSYQDIYKKDPGINNVFRKIEKGEDLSLDLGDLRAIFKSKNEYVIKSYKNAEIINYEILSSVRARIAVRYEIPFSTGDKITNLHGSKGVSGLIVPDDKMPRLKNDIGDFKAGPFEVIISGYSVMRRKSPGQIFEAWANAVGIEFEPGEDFAKFAVQKYRENMKEFSRQSIVEFNGEESIMPCGIIDMIRLYHHATTKISDSYIKANFNKALKMGEQEKLSLCATGSKNILKEFSIRSMKKHDNAYRLVYDIMKTRHIPEDAHLSLEFARMLKSMGLSLEVNGVPLVDKDFCTVDDYGKIFGNVVGNDIIDLEEMYENNDD